MPISETVTLNKSQDDEITVPCMKCVGKTVHKVLVSANLRGEEASGDWSIQWWEDYQIIECAGCKSKSFRKATSSSEDYCQVSEEEWEIAESVDIYPSRIEGRKHIVIEVNYLPKKMRAIYKETTHALNNNSPILAGIGLRALIEAICKEQDANGRTLLNKIDDLVVKKILTPAGCKTLHKIRTLGNDAAHDVKPHSEKQLGLAMDVVEHVLNDIYVLPVKMESEFGE